jgi:hypothetical protein
MQEFGCAEGHRVEPALGWTVRFGGVAGSVRFGASPASGRRDDSPSFGDLEAALAGAEMHERAVLELAAADDALLPIAGTTRRSEAPVVLLDVPAPQAGHAQVVLEADEDGLVRWHLAEATLPGDARRGAGEQQRFRIALQRHASAAPPAPGERRFFGRLLRRVLKVLVFPILDPIVGAIAHAIAQGYESHHAPYRLRRFEAGDFQMAGASELSPDDWPRLRGGRALLWLHGTFSTSHGCFSRLDPALVGELSARYGGRSFALDHWTLAHDPRGNLAWLLEHMPPGPPLEVDIVCHSRGGLLARTLAATWAQDRVRVRRIVFVATPNDGTALAHADHMVRMLERYTNVVQWIPGGVVLDAVLAAVKVLAHGALKGLPGLSAQSPDSDFLGSLRATGAPAADTFAIAADWEPAEGSPLAALVRERIADSVMDGVFRQVANDLVVPTHGVAAATGPGFPIAPGRVHTFGSDRGAVHTNLFGFPETAARLRDWLPGAV